MKPPRFEYFAPRSREEALELLARHGDRARVLAGGQSLIPLLNLRLAQPEALVDINRIPELAFVRDGNGSLVLGALTRLHVLEDAEAVRTRQPLVAEACRFVGHLPIRHRGTLGGNLAHADPASELPAVMLALEAQLSLASQHGTRTVAAAEFFRGALTTALRPGELLTEVRLPALPAGAGTAFVEMSRRAGDFALVGVAAVVALDAAGRCARVRLALCGVGPTPLRPAEAEHALQGEAPHGAALEEAAARAAAATDPPSDIHGSAAFRRRLARHFVRQAVELAARRAGGA